MMLIDDRAEDERTLIRRLLTEPQMESVWREIKKCQPSSAAREDWLLQFDEMPDDDMSDGDVAAGLFFFYACHYGYYQHPIETLTERKALLDSALEPVRELRAMAGRLPTGRARAKHHRAAIAAAADFFEGEIQWFYGKPHPTLVNRNQGDRYQRGFALCIANEVHKLFERMMYGTIATVTNVALVGKRKRVSKANVQDWVHPRRRS